MKGSKISPMKNLKPEYYFDLSKFEHASIFDSCEFVYDVLSKIEEYLAKYTAYKIEVEIPDGVFLVNKEQISIGKGSHIEPGSYIKGPCILGKNCTVRHGAYIRGNFIAGDDSVIGHDTEVKNSILLNNAHAAHFAYLGDSIIGNHVNLGAGTKCANLKLDGQIINLVIHGKTITTGLRKLGALIGDGSSLGCNTVTNPGTFLGKNVISYPCTNFGGFVESNSLVKPDTKNIIKKISSSA